jgi:hypothetical protein
MAKKVVFVGVLVLALVLGVALFGCKQDEDPPCCTADTWKPIAEAEGLEALALIKGLPTCCQEAFGKMMDLLGDPTEAQIKEATGCCYDAIKAAFGE